MPQRGETIDMSLRTVKCTIDTYDFAANYLVDVVDYPLEEELKLYLHHWYYDGMKMHMFDVRKDELGVYGGAGELEDIIEGALVNGPYIKIFKEKYFN